MYYFHCTVSVLILEVKSTLFVMFCNRSILRMACNIRLPLLESQLTCPICLEVFKDPAMLQCGHSYCRDCLWGLMKESHIHLLCPVCRQEVDYSSSPPNVTLKRLIETLKILNEEQAATETCPKHNNPLCLYCEQDQEVICGLCGTIGDHRQHPIKPLTSVYSRMKVNFTFYN